MSYLDEVNPDNLLNVVRDMQQQLQQLAQREVAFNRLDEITSDLGDQRAGRFLALASGVEPTDPDANGSFMSALGELFGDILINLGVVKDGQLQFGFGPDEGVFSGGKGRINSLGILMDGLNFLIRQTATNNDVQRIGKLSMLLPDGETIPAFALEYTSSASTELLTNGGAETGDFTGWPVSSESNGTWSVTDQGAYDGGYCFIFTPTAANNFGVLVADLMAVTGLKNYLVSGRCIINGDGSTSRRVIVEWLNSGATVIRTDTLIPTEYGGIGWNFFEKMFEAPAAAVNARVVLEAGSPNSATLVNGFDTFSFSEAVVSKRFMLTDRGAHVGADIIPVVNNRIPEMPASSMGASNSATNGNVDAGAHSYGITYADAYGETKLISGITSVTAPGGKQVNLTNIPIGNAYAVDRKIYRSKAGTTSPLYLVGALGNNTSTTFVDNVSDADLGAEAPAANTSGSWPVLPRRASWFMNEAAHNLTLLEIASASQIFGASWQTAAPNANNGDSFTFSGMLSAGTYILSVFGVSYTTRGILNWYLDDVLVVSGQNWYSASAVYNVTKTATITVPTSGYHILKGVVSGSTGGGYAIALTKVWLKMAAD
ncbi:hypothetical protein hrd7_25460 [Leptolinea sp. HRD-7]|nr:hypothetical protein hrd7_25460 [Leptolinea sp. HRD-7]